MASRGSVAKNGHVTTTEYRTTKEVQGASVLQGNKGNHGLPDYSHSPNRVYIKENPDGSFRELRVYDESGFPILEIGYHPEEYLTGNRHEYVLHAHSFSPSLERSLIGKVSTTENADIYAKYSNILKEYGL